MKQNITKWSATVATPAGRTNRLVKAHARVKSQHAGTDLREARTEALEHGLHVPTLLHRDDTAVILLVHPDQEGLIVVMPGGTESNVKCQLAINERIHSGIAPIPTSFRPRQKRSNTAVISPPFCMEMTRQ